MLPDIGWAELLMVAVIAIIVVGPKDLPKMLRSLGQWMAKARSMAREFQRSFDEMTRESELAELRKDVEKLKADNPLAEVKREIESGVDEVKSIAPKGSIDDYFGGYDPTGTTLEDSAAATADAEPEADEVAKVAEPTTEPEEKKEEEPVNPRPGVEKL